MFPIDLPITITWEPLSFVGFKSIGFIHTSGCFPAASACTACALPISIPSAVIYELSAIFCDLKGATLYPSCVNILHKAVQIRLFPTFDIVPCIIIAFATHIPPKQKSISYFLHVFLPLHDNTFRQGSYNFRSIL